MRPRCQLATLAYEPMFLEAHLWSGNNGFRELGVYVSPLVDSADPWLLPVAEFLRMTCFEETSRITVPDEEMMFGQAERITYRIFPECPGDVLHNCMIERQR
ncbi:hypothetical protein GCM10012275_15330 [Longimycelium tulufanense]|uniref:Uncharacterized protein n=1 Tax=Longimycelium tulufanense TaxID=907463 RepID=A0A8J3CCA6_9PSEU|nr:hypothetical protein GCM10012275_15330 [Longimycelium tulufanense]